MDKSFVLPLLHLVTDMMSWRDYDTAVIVIELSHAMAEQHRAVIISETYHGDS
jgi:hypothetical protein